MSGHVLCVWLLFCLSSSVRAQARVLGASEPVVALAGDDATLPCRCEPPVDLGPLTVEWSRTELKPRPSDPLKIVPFVHVYTDGHDDQDMKIPEFTGRTLLFPERLGAGNASLQIQRVRPSDNGTYKCFLPNLRTGPGLKEAYVTLIVLEAVIPNNDTSLDPEVQEEVLDVQEDQPNSRFSRLFSPTIISFAAFGILCVGIIVVLKYKKCIWTTLQKRSDQAPPQSENEARAVAPAVEPVKTLEEVQLLIPESSTDDAQRWKLSAG